MECEDEGEGEGETKCKGTKQMGQNEWDEVNVGRNDRVPTQFAHKYDSNNKLPLDYFQGKHTVFSTNLWCSWLKLIK